jgi:hypothetical protein
MLMDASPEERYFFIERITRDAEPRFHRTHEGEPAKQDWWRAYQPLFYAAARIQEHREQAA